MGSTCVYVCVCVLLCPPQTTVKWAIQLGPVLLVKVAVVFAKPIVCVVFQVLLPLRHGFRLFREMDGRFVIPINIRLEKKKHTGERITWHSRGEETTASDPEQSDQQNYIMEYLPYEKKYTVIKILHNIHQVHDGQVTMALKK